MNNPAFIMIVSLFIVIFVIVAYFVLTDSLYKDDINTFSPQLGRTPGLNRGNACDPEVFHISDNKFSYEDAKAACMAYNSRLATLEEMIDAYKKGANWCNYGWSDEQLALYPIQKDFWNEIQNDPENKYDCGTPGLNGGYFENKHYRFGANCYGPKPGLSHENYQKMKNRAYKRKDPVLKRSLEMKDTINNYTIAPFNNFSRDMPWSSYNISDKNDSVTE